jgi:short-subunit dehydrogenase
MFFVDDLLWSAVTWISAWIGLISVVTFIIYLGAQQLLLRLPEQNLKRKYSSSWAIVTGSSSGIGKAIAEKLASQGVSVVLAALDDTLLANTFAELQKRYPSVSFRKVGVNLGQDGRYMDAIVEATRDIDVNLVFNNAGYICPGLFADTEYDRLRANFECNAGCVVPITHHFLRLMLLRKQRGLIAFTSSSACYFPGPTATLYSSTKAFVTNFAVTLAAEVKTDGIDVVAMHPSPVATNFYKTVGPALSSLQTAQKAGISPSVIADQIFASAGRLTVWDQGSVSFIFRLVNKILDFGFFSEVVARLAWLNKDHQDLLKASKLRGGATSAPKKDL